MDSCHIVTLTINIQDSAFVNWAPVFESVFHAAKSHEHCLASFNSQQPVYRVLCTIIIKTTMSTYDFTILDTEVSKKMWIAGKFYGYSKFAIFNLAHSVADPLNLNSVHEICGSSAFPQTVMMEYVKKLSVTANMDYFSTAATSTFSLKQANVTISNAFAFCCEDNNIACHRSVREVAGVRLIFNGQRAQFLNKLRSLLPRAYITALLNSASNVQFFVNVSQALMDRINSECRAFVDNHKMCRELVFYCLCCMTSHLQITPAELDEANEAEPNEKQPRIQENPVPFCQLPLEVLPHNIFAEHIKSPSFLSSLLHFDIHVNCFYEHEVENIENIRSNLLVKTHSLNTMYNT
uniref:Uncharacterized protein U6 n=1 Tax=Hyposoter didymator TaxID=260305 RepID=D7P5M8_HYPDD|nr:unknown [Hyposoter didymator]